MLGATAQRCRRACVLQVSRQRRAKSSVAVAVARVLHRHSVSNHCTQPARIPRLLVASSRLFSDSISNNGGGGDGVQEFWPDGTPKKFSGKDSWKNWIDWDSKFRQPTDELNRARKFFFEVDAKGRLFRLEFDQPGKRFGELRDGRTLEHFFSHLKHNDTGEYSDMFPFVSLRMHEKYYTRACYNSVLGASEAQNPARNVLQHTCHHGIGAPMVFNDYDADSGYLLRRLPEGQTPKSLQTQLCLSKLHVTFDGQLFHEFESKLSAKQREEAPATTPRDVSPLLALVEVTTAHRLFDELQIRIEEGPEGACCYFAQLPGAGVEERLQLLPHSRTCEAG